MDPYKDSRQTEIVRSEVRLATFSPTQLPLCVSFQFPVTNGDDQVHHNLSNGRVSEPERDYHSPTAAPAVLFFRYHVSDAILIFDFRQLKSPITTLPDKLCIALRCKVVLASSID